MDSLKVASFLKELRKEKGLTQSLSVIEKVKGSRKKIVLFETAIITLLVIFIIIFSVLVIDASHKRSFIREIVEDKSRYMVNIINMSDEEYSQFDYTEIYSDLDPFKIECSRRQLAEMNPGKCNYIGMSDYYVERAGGEYRAVLSVVVKYDNVDIVFTFTYNENMRNTVIAFGEKNVSFKEYQEQGR